MKIGYAFWGFLGDRKYNDLYEEISTPDGNAFYSWSIIKAFLDAGHEVSRIMPDRDFPGFKCDKNIFSSWCEKERKNAYENSGIKVGKDFDFILLEWRWEIEGRNTLDLEGTKGWQPDLKIRNEIISFANKNKIPLIIFDLDYKLTEEDVVKYNIKHVIELGNKWSSSKLVRSKKVFIPFDFNCINELKIAEEFRNTLVYIGNRYERDWCIDKYIPEDLVDCIIYGNWKEAGRDSEERWRLLNFGERLQTSQMYETYSRSVATILLAKKEYCEMEFMTARIVESIFYGCVPLFMKEYGEKTIMQYAGRYADFLCVKSKEDVKERVLFLKENPKYRKEIIEYLRIHLRFMDCKFFVKDLEEMVV